MAQGSFKSVGGWVVAAILGLALINRCGGEPAANDLAPEPYSPQFDAAEAAARDATLAASEAAMPQPLYSSPAPAPEPVYEPPVERDVYFQNCSDARASGAAPVYAGDPGYARRLDRDGDGVGCE